MTDEVNHNKHLHGKPNLNLQFESALTSTPIQKEVKTKTTTNTKRISPNKTVSEAKKVGGRRTPVKSNTQPRGHKRKREQHLQIA